jgi:hypothetical protein
VTADNFQAMVDGWRSIANLDGGADTPVGRALLDACNELDRLQDRVQYLNERYAELRHLELGIKNLTTDTGAVDMSLHMAHDMMRILVAGFVKILDEEGGPNYAELSFKLAGTTDRYTLTIRRPGGKTPAEVASEQRKRAEQAEAALDPARDIVERALRKGYDITGFELDDIANALGVSSEGSDR